MNFLIRSVRESDLNGLHSLAAQFSLLNLPSNEDVLAQKIDRSVKSFAGKTKKRADSEYLFVVEDRERQAVVGSALILGKHGTSESPHIFFKIRKEEKFSQDLGVGFIHQILKLGHDSDGPTEIGGLLIDRSYRRRPEKLGRQVSLIRFLFMGMDPKRFEKRILCEFAPPLTRDGRSEFWEAIGRRFTGLSYQEADLISQRYKEFIKSLFPTGEIYTSLLDTRARQVMGQVSEETRPAQHLLERLGFTYLNEIDPFDGGPHFGAQTLDIPLVGGTKSAKVRISATGPYRQHALIGFVNQGQFIGGQSPIEVQDEEVWVPATTARCLGVEQEQEIFYTILEV